MENKIEAGKTFAEVQEEFSRTFPYLKIDLVMNSIHSKELCLTTKNGHTQIADKISYIILTDNTTVKEIVHHFKALFNLSVKVQRKSDGEYVDTILTENWTLSKQNIEGKNMADFDFRKLNGD